MVRSSASWRVQVHKPRDMHRRHTFVYTCTLFTFTRAAWFDSAHAGKLFALILSPLCRVLSLFTRYVLPVRHSYAPPTHPRLPSFAGARFSHAASLHCAALPSPLPYPRFTPYCGNSLRAVTYISIRTTLWFRHADALWTHRLPYAFSATRNTLHALPSNSMSKRNNGCWRGVWLRDAY